MNARDKILLRKKLAAGEFKEALSQVDALLQVEKSDHLFLIRAKSLYTLERYNEALDTIKGAIASSQSKSDFLLLVGHIYSKTGNYAKAKEFYQHTLKHNPENVEALALYATLLFSTGEKEASKRALVKALTLEPHNFFSLNAFYVISLSLHGRKKEAEILKTLYPSITGETFHTIHNFLIACFCEEKKRRRKELQLVKKLYPRKNSVRKTLTLLEKKQRLCQKDKELLLKNERECNHDPF